MIYYINLDGELERDTFIRNELAQAGLRAERIAGVRGAETPYLTAGEAGCYASHRKAWSAILERGVAWALVLEDDASLVPGFRLKLDALLLDLPMQWDLVHLYGEARFSLPLRQTGEHTIVRYSRAPAGSVGYLISNAGARKLLHTKTLRWPVDTDFRRPWHFRLESYGVEPPLVEHIFELPGTIATRSRGRRGIGRNPLHSLRGACWSIQRLGLTWWLYAACGNALHKTLKALVPRKILKRQPHNERQETRHGKEAHAMAKPVL